MSRIAWRAPVRPRPAEAWLPQVGLLRFGRAFCAGQLDRHRGARAWLGVDLDRATHRLEQSCRDGQSETDAFDVGDVRTESLEWLEWLEWLEQLRQLLGSDPAAGIGDRRRTPVARSARETSARVACGRASSIALTPCFHHPASSQTSAVGHIPQPRTSSAASRSINSITRKSIDAPRSNRHALTCPTASRSGRGFRRRR